LADAATTLCRGEAAAASAAATAQATFEQGGAGDDLPRANAGADGIKILDALRELGFAPSNKEARRKLDEGAVRVDGDVVRDPQLLLHGSDGGILISLGAKKRGLIVH
jgi:tyrosyl-tRNA synthetase